MAIMLVVGLMNLCVMAVLTAVIMLERLTRADARITRGIGAVVVASGLIFVALAIS